jgi:pentatricopeptide repeat protein
VVDLLDIKPFTYVVVIAHTNKYVGVIKLSIVLEVLVKTLVKELQDIGGCLMTKQLELNLGDTPYEDTFSKSKREKTTRLGKEAVNIVPRVTSRDRSNTNSSDGRVWGRRSTDGNIEEAVSLFNRMQKSREIQRDIRCAGTSNYTFENGTPWRNKDES